MNIDPIEKEISDSIREILLSKGVDESHVKIKVKTKMASSEMPVGAQRIKGSEEIVEWPKAFLTVVKMNLSVRFAVPDRD